MAIIKLNDRELSTVLAALHYWQRTAILTPELPEYDIATENCDSDGPMNPEEIDELCEGMNLDGMTFADCKNHFAAPEGDATGEAARAKYHAEGCIEIDDRAVISRGVGPDDAGAYVMAWVWVDDPSDIMDVKEPA